MGKKKEDQIALAWGLAWDRWTAVDHAYAIDPDDIDDEADAVLHRSYSDAFDALIGTPAPSIGRVADKLQQARRRWVDFEMPDDVLNAIDADLRRLAGAGA